MDPNIKTITRSVTDLMLIGVLASLIGGLILLARFLTAAPVTIDVINVWGGVPFFAGVGILCFRFGVTLDRQNSTSTKWRGLLVPFHKSTPRTFSRTCYVSISNRRSFDSAKASSLDNALAPLVPGNDGLAVRLQEAGSDAITLREMQDYDEARRFGEEVAKFLHVELRDRSSVEEVVREAGKLDHPLQEQLRDNAQPAPLPARIDGARALFSHGAIGAPTSIELPPAGTNSRSLWKATLGVLAWLLVCATGFGKVRTGMGSDALLFLLVALFLFGLVIAARLLIRAADYREHVVIAPGEFVITRQSSSGVETTRMNSAEIEEVAVITLQVPRSFHDSMRRVVIRSDRGSIELGATLLKAEEVRWLRDVLIHFLTPAPSKPGVADA